VTLYCTGKYIITGSSSEAEAGRLRDEFLTVLHRHEIVSAADDAWFTVQNYVCMSDMERPLNLSALAAAATVITPLSETRFRITDIQEHRINIEFVNSGDSQPLQRE